MKQKLFPLVLSLLLIASCSVGPVQVKFGEGENEPPATLFLFNLDQPNTQVFVYEEVLKAPSEDVLSSLAGGSRRKLEQVAVVSGQRYVRIPIRPRLITLRMATAPVSSEVQKDFFPNRPGPQGYLEAFRTNANSNQNYYATVRARSASEYGPNASDILLNLATGPVLEGVVFGATGVWISSQPEWQSLGDIRADAISSEQAQDLMGRLKQQDLAELQPLPVAQPSLNSSP